jgi:hypothetical protein
LTAKARARNSPPWRSPSGSMPCPTPADKCHCAGTPSAARPCAAWNSACAGMRSSWSPCTSSTGGRDRIASANFRIAVRRQHQDARIADDRRRRHAAAQPDMQRHHRALAEADQRQRRWRQAEARKLGIDEALQHRCRFVDSDPALVRIAKRQGEPLPPHRRAAARLRCMRRHERRLRQQGLPRPAEFDEVVAVGAVAVQKHHQLPRRAGARCEPRTIKLSGHSPSCRLAQALAANARRACARVAALTGAVAACLSQNWVWKRLARHRRLMRATPWLTRSTTFAGDEKVRIMTTSLVRPRPLRSRSGPPLYQSVLVWDPSPGSRSTK